MASAKQSKPNRAEEPFDVLDDFERFSQVDDVFARSFHDPAIRTEKSDTFYATYRQPLTTWRKAKGFTQRDYALRNASWHVSDVFTEMHEADGRRDGFLDPLSMLRDGPDQPLPSESPAIAASEIKSVAKTFGADLVGITTFDERWIYTERFDAATGKAKPNELPDGLSHVIVIGQAMDHDLIKTAPSALSGAATGLGYSQDAAVLLGVAQYIKNLGYEAVASMNDTALAIPYAIAAGLGEYARNGLVITPEHGPRLRFGKILTNMPLSTDAPKTFGVAEFCNNCDRCAQACPAKAIPFGEPVPVQLNRSSIKGVRKWSVDGEACFSYWSKINSDCAICVRVCPYTRDYGQRRNRLWRRLAGTRLRSFMLWIDDQAQAGKRLKPDLWWQARRNGD